MMKSLIVRVAGGALALGLMAVALGAAPRPAAACGGPHCPHDPTTLPGNIPQSPVQLAQLPDLVVWFTGADCKNGVMHLTLRVQNMGPGPAGDFYTDVKADGQTLSGLPHFTPGPTYGGQQFHVDLNMRPGSHSIFATVDSTQQVKESNEGNNTAFTLIHC